MEVNEADVDAFVAASKPILDEWIAESGPDAQTLIDLVQKAAAQ